MGGQVRPSRGLTEGDVRLVAEHLVLATLLVRAP